MLKQKTFQGKNKVVNGIQGKIGSCLVGSY